MVDKKTKERTQLRIFWSRCPDFPEGEVIHDDAPDFLVGDLGIEFTEYIRQQNGVAVRTQERIRDGIVRKAQQKFETQCSIPVVASILWHEHEPPRPNQKESLAEGAVQLVRSHVASRAFDQNKIELKRVEPKRGSSLNEFVQAIYVFSAEGLNYWTNWKVGSIDGRLSELEIIIAEKNAKLNSYLQKCRRTWLVIVADGPDLSSRVEFPDNLKDHRFQTNFDRTSDVNSKWLKVRMIEHQ